MICLELRLRPGTMDIGSLDEGMKIIHRDEALLEDLWTDKVQIWLAHLGALREFWAVLHSVHIEDCTTAIERNLDEVVNVCTWVEDVCVANDVHIIENLLKEITKVRTTSRQRNFI